MKVRSLLAWLCGIYCAVVNFSQVAAAEPKPKSTLDVRAYAPTSLAALTSARPENPASGALSETSRAWFRINGSLTGNHRKPSGSIRPLIEAYAARDPFVIRADALLMDKSEYEVDDGNRKYWLVVGGMPALFAVHDAEFPLAATLLVHRTGYLDGIPVHIVYAISTESALNELAAKQALGERPKPTRVASFTRGEVKFFHQNALNVFPLDTHEDSLPLGMFKDAYPDRYESFVSLKFCSGKACAFVDLYRMPDEPLANVDLAFSGTDDRGRRFGARKGACNVKLLSATTALVKGEADCSGVGDSPLLGHIEFVARP
jgi:hypothetical protein